MDMNYTLGDLAAATRGADNDWGGGGSWWIVLLFLVLFGGGNGFGWGNRGGGASEADVQRGFDQQATTSKLDQLAYGQANMGYETARLVNGVEMQAAQLAAQNQLALCQGFGGVNSAIADVARQVAECCCEIKGQLAQDKIESLQAKVSEQAAVIGNMRQSQYILDQMGRWRSNPPCSDGCGCGGYGYGFAA